jgi:copper chaperone
MSIVTAHIDGMSCNHCLNAINQALDGLDGVRVESVRMGRAEVELLPGSATTSDDVVAAIEAAGYAVAHVGISG